MTENLKIQIALDVEQSKITEFQTEIEKIKKISTSKFNQSVKWCNFDYEILRDWMRNLKAYELNPKKNNDVKLVIGILHGRIEPSNQWENNPFKLFEKLNEKIEAGMHFKRDGVTNATNLFFVIDDIALAEQWWQKESPCRIRQIMNGVIDLLLKQLGKEYFIETDCADKKAIKIELENSI